MVVPWQVLTDGNTQIFSFRCYVQFLPMDEVRWWYDLTLDASSVWAPHTQSDINKLESVQRRAAMFATGNYNTTSSVTTMLNHLNWDTLQQRRLRTKAIKIWLPGFPFWRIPGPRLLLWPLVVVSITGLWMERRTLCVQLFCCMTAFLRRNLSSCPANIRTKCYTTFVRPQLEYASSVWAPHLSTYFVNMVVPWQVLTDGNTQIFPLDVMFNSFPWMKYDMMVWSYAWWLCV
jgi:hypothetical protein